ncbi:hypothetical protein CTAYLR_007709 [Chrysophaeum taylorii]|uniref:Ammonium transporter n=1 Tax=Chrysophaeum taylorii TaxID=2483200 RepID=A0AAD7UD76_9STRA|nr:hypothetical protein CTAYLR_007709 [Chrysophaeum taylorii]
MSEEDDYYFEKDHEARIAALEELVREKVDEKDADAVWLVTTGTVLVFLMQAGFACLEVGSVQVKNTKNILLKNIFDASAAAILWWSVGHAFAYGTDAFEETGKNGFIGGSGFFLEDAKLHGQAKFLFEWAFAGTAATIVSGAVAERFSLMAYFLLSCFISGFVFPVVTHLVWSTDGKFSIRRNSRLVGGCGVVDFAGSGVVHATGGVAALVACVFAGPRLGRFRGRHLQQQSVIFQSLGTLILWVGWYGFNAVSTLEVARGGLAAHAATTTTLAAAASCLTTTSLGYWFGDRVVDPRYANNGILAGLVSITAGCATVSLFGSLAIGVTASPIYLFASYMLEKIHVDDVVDAFPVHGVCGLWGVIAASLLSTDFYYAQTFVLQTRRPRCRGLLYGGSFGSLRAALLFLLAHLAFVVSATSLFLFALSTIILLRVPENIEDFGNDDSKHGGHVDFFPAAAAAAARPRRQPPFPEIMETKRDEDAAAAS